MRYEIFTGHRLEVYDAGADAASAWQRWHRRPGATFRIVIDTGEEYGALRPGEMHGRDGVLTERCPDCRQEFRTLHVGEVFCPGCQLLMIGSTNLRR